MTNDFRSKAYECISRKIEELDELKRTAIPLFNSLVVMDRIVKNWEDIRYLERQCPDRLANANPNSGEARYLGGRK